MPGLGKSPSNVQLKKKQVRAGFGGTNVAGGGHHEGNPGRVWELEQSFVLEVFGSGLGARVARAPLVPHSFAYIPASLTLFSTVEPL